MSDHKRTWSPSEAREYARKLAALQKTRVSQSAWDELEATGLDDRAAFNRWTEKWFSLTFKRFEVDE